LSGRDCALGLLSDGAAVTTPDDILRFWFPPGLDADEETHVRQTEWWFRGGADQAIVQSFTHVLEAAARGECDHWAANARSRLALIIVLDQFSRSVYRDTAMAYAQDAKALVLTIEGMDNGHYDQIPTVWEKAFFLLPLAHSECLALHERLVALCETMIDEVPEKLRRIYAFSTSQARGHRDVIARFGRHPHRNAALGRTSSKEERAYIAKGEFVHRRSITL
jgi:uncharacterized protein (DUF924 family)